MMEQKLCYRPEGGRKYGQKIGQPAKDVMRSRSGCPFALSAFVIGRTIKSFYIIIQSDCDRSRFVAGVRVERTTITVLLGGGISGGNLEYAKACFR